MDGSGARDGFGAPPWGPADPVPDLDDTPVLPGLGPIQGPGDGPGSPERGYGSANGYRANGQPADGGWRQSPPSPRPQPGSWPNGPAPTGPWPVGQRPQPNYDGRAQPGGPPQPYYDDRAQPDYNGRMQPDYNGHAQPDHNGRMQPDYNGRMQPGGPPRDDGAQRGARGSHRSGAPGPGPGGPGGGGPGGPGDGPETAQDPDAGPGTGNGKRRRRSFWRELPVLVVVALVLALVIKSFVVQAFYIPSASMQKTLEIGDRVLINKVVYHLRSIHRGDIVVFDGSTSWDAGTQQPSGNFLTKAADELEGIVGISHDSSIYIKRVIGLPGDTIKCCNARGQVTVNGVALSESSFLYPGNAPSTTKFKEVVPPNSLWVMGDHRAVSFDSRGHTGDPGGGAIPVSAVLGRAFVIIWPPSHWGFLNIPATFEQPQLNASKAAGGQVAAGGSTTVLDSALANGTPLQPAYSSLPLALGLAGAVPITWLHRRVRLRRRRKSKLAP